MSAVDELLRRFIAEYRASGRVDARSYLEQVSGFDRIELAAHIDRYLARSPRRPFDAEAFARFRADPERQAMVQRILDDTTLEALRKQARVSKARVASSLAAALGLSGREQQVKARYHDIESGNVDPKRVRPLIWDALAQVLGGTSDRLRKAAESTYAGAGGGLSGVAYARMADGFVVGAVGAPFEEDLDRDDTVDRAFFED